MQNKNIAKTMHSAKTFQRMKTINFRFVGLLCIAFLFQHFSFATIQNQFGFSNLATGIEFNSYFEKGAVAHHDSDLEFLVESASEEEDEIHNEQAHSNATLANNRTFKSIHYTGFINTLYLRLASTHLHKVPVPFFVLYHSWKTHLA